MDLSSTVASFYTGTYTVTRAAKASANSSGRAATPSSSTLSVPAMVAPVGGRDLERLPEGLRTKQLLVIYTPTELKTAGSGFEADVVSISGDSWQVQSVEPWAVLGNFWACIAMRVGS